METVLVWAGSELIFFTPAGTVLQFGFTFCDDKYYRLIYYRSQLMRCSALEPHRHWCSYTPIALVAYEGAFSSQTTLPVITTLETKENSNRTQTKPSRLVLSVALYRWVLGSTSITGEKHVTSRKNCDTGSLKVNMRISPVMMMMIMIIIIIIL